MTEAPALPVLPAPFWDCHRLIVGEGEELTPIPAFLTDTTLQTAVTRYVRQWGPGDSRAAASLWTQGYFLRLVRPVLAYGVLFDRWFSIDENSRVVVSPMSNAAGFRLTEASRDEAMPALFDHIEHVVSFTAMRTRTSARVHASNAEYIVARTLMQLEPLAVESVVKQSLAVVRRYFAGQPYGLRKSLREHAGCDHHRRICCLRYLLQGLNKCERVCPIGTVADGAASMQDRRIDQGSAG